MIKKLFCVALAIVLIPAASQALTPTPTPRPDPTTTPFPPKERQGDDNQQKLTFTCTVGVTYNSPGETPRYYPETRQRVCSALISFKHPYTSARYTKVLECGVGRGQMSCARTVTLQQLSIPPGYKPFSIKAGSLLSKTEECYSCIAVDSYPRANIVFDGMDQALGFLVDHRHHCARFPSADVLACPLIK